MLGFLTGESLTKSDVRHSSGNYGLLDQIAVLRWVQRNIGTFGGDPTKVLLMGIGSGGAGAALALAYSPISYGLFQRLWLMSPAVRVDTTLAAAHILDAQHTTCKNRACFDRLSAHQLMRNFSWSRLDSYHLSKLFDMPPTRQRSERSTLVIDGQIVQKSIVQFCCSALFTCSDSNW